MPLSANAAARHLPRHVVAVAVVAVQLVVIGARNAPAQTAAEARCRTQIARGVAGYVDRTLKSIAKCHNRRSKGREPLSVDCNDVAQADPSARLDKAAAKLRKAINGDHGACLDAPAVLARYDRCPSPAADTDDGGATTGIDSFDELVDCMTALAGRLAGQATAAAMGLPEDQLDASALKCQKTIGKELRRVFANFAKQRRHCQDERDAAGMGLTYGCDAYDEGGKIAQAIERLDRSLDRRCNLDADPTLSILQELDRLKACGDTPQQLRHCIGEVVGQRLGSGLVAMAYELPSGCRAGRMIRISNAGFGNELTDSSFSGGWTGLGHDIDLTDGFRDAMTLDCDDDCANCQLSLDPLVGDPSTYCRCASDASIPCNTPNGPDLDDCGGLDNTCECFLGPPVAVAAGGAPACIAIRIDQGHGGTIDVGTGEWANTLGLSAVMHLGLDLAAPCPLCVGDDAIADGVANGTCDGGARDGLPCDVTTLHRTFGPSSLDCQPRSITNISGSGLALSIDMTTADTVLPYTLPCDDPGELCPCRVCSDDSTIGCHDDDLCAAAGAGTCTGGGGAGVKRNACTDGLCSDDGECVNGPVDKFCDGMTYADGRGYVACATDLDCSVLSAGSCTIEERRRCYTDPITTSGQPGIFGGVAGTAACIGLTTSVVINQATGLPAPVRVILDFDAEVGCASDPARPFDPPAGANCVATTTTTLPTGLPCVATFPACGGSCPLDQVCTSLGAACLCESATTTTLPGGTACEGTFPLCNGSCSPGASCSADLLGLACVCSP